MKIIPDALQASLSSGTTTLCWCWRITRRSGERLGFTDHDCDLTFDATLFEAASGFTATEFRESVGLAVDNLEVESALASSHLSEAALGSGDFDDAAIEVFRVDWSNPAVRVLVRRGTLGEVRRNGVAFTAEVRGLSHYLAQPRGRVIQMACDADLGDSRCGVDLEAPGFRAEGAVLVARTDRLFTTADLSAFEGGWFTRGLLSFTSGANVGRRSEIKRHGLAGGIAQVELWQALGAPLAPGDAFAITAGCDRQFVTCRGKFANAANFRGFPHLPGNDFLASPRRAE
ncbi:MAG: DUF2163 domain-containing protein [Hyphomicrobiaceae bacterium]|nr:DUF2163 domain-containing protein [Hyphomicrobiaceae bacterium]